MKSTSPTGLPLFLILVGALLMAAAVTARYVTGRERLLVLVAVGGAVQFAGWVLFWFRLGKQRGQR
ncbi:hypothetical protein [Streptomyces sp. ODS28]|uniref:hypothetical protein n=1 Tax=Streptomyces sp. ODS28 TaxID=3136688 RepID=UPI0031EC96BF